MIIYASLKRAYFLESVNNSREAFSLIFLDYYDAIGGLKRSQSAEASKSLIQNIS